MAGFSSSRSPDQAIAAEPAAAVMPVVYGTHLPGLGDPASRLAKLVAKLSGGALELDLKQPGDGTQPQEILEKVCARQASMPAFHREPLGGEDCRAAILFAGFPFGPDAKGYVEWFFAGNGRKILSGYVRRGGLPVHVIPCAFGGAESLRLVRQGDQDAGGHQRAAHARLRPWRTGNVEARRHEPCSFREARSARPSTA